MEKAIVLMKDGTEQVVHGAKSFEMKKGGTLEVYGEGGMVALYSGNAVCGVKLEEESEPADKERDSSSNKGTRLIRRHMRPSARYLDPSDGEEIYTRGIGAGSIVRHFKADPGAETGEYIYMVYSNNVIDATTGERCVLYAKCPEKGMTGKSFVRPYKEFFSEVDKAKYPNAKQKYRFEKVEE